MAVYTISKNNIGDVRTSCHESYNEKNHKGLLQPPTKATILTIV